MPNSGCQFRPELADQIRPVVRRAQARRSRPRRWPAGPPPTPSSTTRTAWAACWTACKRQARTSKPAALGSRAAAHAALENPRVVANLLASLRRAGAGQQAAALADRAAAYVPLDDPYGVANLLASLLEAGAGQQAAALTGRLPAAGMFGLFLELAQAGVRSRRLAGRAGGGPAAGRSRTAVAPRRLIAATTLNDDGRDACAVTAPRPGPRAHVPVSSPSAPCGKPGGLRGPACCRLRPPRRSAPSAGNHRTAWSSWWVLIVVNLPRGGRARGDAEPWYAWPCEPGTRISHRSSRSSRA